MTESGRLTLAPITGASLSLTDQVMAEIRDAVRRGSLVPGELYSAYQLADLLGVSRSPVREALVRLAEVGMVQLERNRGFRVVLPEPRQIAEIFPLRLLLEVPAARRAARQPSAELTESLHRELDAMRAAASVRDERLFMQHDQRLHDLILDAAGNDRLTSLIDGLRDITRLLGASTVDRSRSLADIAAEHEPIVAAIAAGDVDGAAAAQHGHITHTGRLLVAQVVGDDAAGTDPDALWRQVVGEAAESPPTGPLT
jgi:DNA-binding GntR family transcriptional regulator